LPTHFHPKKRGFGTIPPPHFFDLFSAHCHFQSPPKEQMTMTGQNGTKIGTDTVKQGLAQMLKGGVIVRTLQNIPLIIPMIHKLTHISIIYSLV
jgi:hypothetical protein